MAVEALKSRSSADRSGGRILQTRKTASIHKSLSVVRWKTQLEGWTDIYYDGPKILNQLDKLLLISSRSVVRSVT